MNLLDIRISASRRGSAKPQAREPAPVPRHEGFGAFYSSRITPTQKLLCDAHRLRRQKFFPPQPVVKVAPPPPQPIKVMLGNNTREPTLIFATRPPVDRDWMVVASDMVGLTNQPLTVRGIQKAVCEYFQISMMELLSSRREIKLVFYRHTAIYLVKTLTALSLPAIGRLFGNRDHTTVLNAIRKIEAKRQKNEVIDEMLRAITAALVSGKNNG